MFLDQETPKLAIHKMEVRDALACCYHGLDCQDVGKMRADDMVPSTALCPSLESM